MKKPNRYRTGSAIAAIGTAVPKHRYQQRTIADFMVRYFQYEKDIARKVSYIYDKSGIDYRHSVLPDFHQNGHLPVLFSSKENNPLLSNRLGIYNQGALELSAAAVADCMKNIKNKNRKKLSEITHLITVSCTGMSAPGLDIQLMQHLSLPKDINRTSVNFMGCYAGFHAMKMADAICKSNDDAIVLIVLAELCSLHFQPGTDMENLVVNSLFADGAAAALITSGKKLKNTDQPALGFSGFHAEVIHEGSEFMTWQPDEKGFLMGLDALVPKLIEDNAAQLVKQALNKLSLKKSAVKHWAFHPGGRKILEAIQRSVNIEKEEFIHSYNVLRNFGNMSSPTILFVLKMIWQAQKKWRDNDYIFAAGFGPGLTIETAMLQPVIA
ncbi:MAG: type III polyketide synthase [Chitinophagales bacterium]|nr:type III polyketide synthase [Chitinophagales bacterium]